MDSREWMYMGWRNKRDFFSEFGRNVDESCKKAFDKGQYKVQCPCSKCENKSDQTQLTMGKHIITYGFVENYTRWICHGEAQRARDEILRQHIEEFDDEARCGDMLEDFHQANFDEGPDHVMKEALKAYYDMLSSAQKPIHKHTTKFCDPLLFCRWCRALFASP
jgi:hypothetical protein